MRVGEAWQGACLVLLMGKTKGTCSARYCFSNFRTKMIVFPFCKK